MKIAVCDDDVKIANKLKDMIESYPHGDYKVDVFSLGTQLLENSKGYGIYFLDINLSDTDGISVAESIREKDRQAFIIFVTNYEGYYQRAFSVHAFQYIVKPFSYDQVFHLLDEIELYHRRDKQNKEICFKGQKGYVKIKISDIYYFEFANRKIKLVTEDHQSWLDGTLRDIAAMMEQYEFVIPHKAFIINMRKIAEVKGYDIWMANGDRIPIAQKKAHLFKKHYVSYLLEQVQA